VYNELKKSPKEEYAIFLSDMHVGSKQFLNQSFEKFIKWINGEMGDEKQRELVKKTKYVFIMGDIVDGVGVYPGQEKELEIADIYAQYAEAAKFLKKIPTHMTIIMCPGNHDAVRMAEPQMPFYEDIAKPLYELPNAIIVSNPAVVTIGAQQGFPGITVLLYHGYSFDYYIANVDEIRNNGGYDRADLVMKFLLQKRHLAPTHASGVYVPYPDHDPLIISKIPDIFATGHLHKTSVSTYRNVTLICGSCWQGKTTFQEKVGHNPEPGRVPLVNLQTREMKILRFGE
jgi:DNA polymerase II small subunit